MLNGKIRETTVATSIPKEAWLTRSPQWTNKLFTGFL